MKKSVSASKEEVIVDIFETDGGFSKCYLTSKVLPNRDEATKYVKSFNYAGFVEGAPTPMYLERCQSYAKIRV